MVLAPTLTSHVGTLANGAPDWSLGFLIPLPAQSALICDCGARGCVVMWENGQASCATCLQHDENLPVLLWCQQCAWTPTLGCLEHHCPDCGKRTHGAPEAHDCPEGRLREAEDDAPCCIAIVTSRGQDHVPGCPAL